VSPDIVIALAGNKCDTPLKLRNVNSSLSARYAKEKNVIHLETSAKEMINVEKLFTEIGKKNTFWSKKWENQEENKLVSSV
jgi:GTPase SAR1 family protein